MPQAILKISRAEFKEALRIPESANIVGINYNAQTDTLDITISHARLPDVQPIPVVKMVYKGFMRKTLYELQDDQGNVIDEWAKWAPDRP